MSISPMQTGMTLSTETAPGKTAPGKTAPITLQDNVWIDEFELDDDLQLLGGNTLGVA